jgi:hypothetical protein
MTLAAPGRFTKVSHIAPMLSVATKGGSGPLSVMRSAGEQDAFAQEVWVRPSVHLSFDHLDPVDVAFDGAGVVGPGEAGGDGGPVLAQVCGAALPAVRD